MYGKILILWGSKADIRLTMPEWHSSVSQVAFPESCQLAPMLNSLVGCRLGLWAWYRAQLGGEGSVNVL